jgi:hypothetical protein
MSLIVEAIQIQNSEFDKIRKCFAQHYIILYYYHDVTPSKSLIPLSSATSSSSLLERPFKTCVTRKIYSAVPNVMRDFLS